MLTVAMRCSRHRLRAAITLGQGAVGGRVQHAFRIRGGMHEGRLEAKFRTPEFGAGPDCCTAGCASIDRELARAAGQVRTSAGTNRCAQACEVIRRTMPARFRKRTNRAQLLRGRRRPFAADRDRCKR
eukprot:364051-Chlamydomonas_euryale.AAC.4